MKKRVYIREYKYCTKIYQFLFMVEAGLFCVYGREHDMTDYTFMWGEDISFCKYKLLVDYAKNADLDFLAKELQKAHYGCVLKRED